MLIEKNHSVLMREGNSHYDDIRQKVLEKLENVESDLNVVVMPDFFLDHSLICDFDARTLTRRMLNIASRGGGEISDVPQTLEVGGNAAICTLALARLGASVHPMMKTDTLGLFLIRYFYDTPKIDLSGIKLTGSLSPTTILELRRRSGLSNIMIGDSSNISPFGFEDLDSADLAVIVRSNYVCVFDWLYNKKGTALAEQMFEYSRANSRAQTFFDAADPTPRIKELPELNRRVFKKGLIDFWGVNENEALVFAKLFERNLKRRGRNAALEAGSIISSNSGAKTFLHTAEYAASMSGEDVTLVPSFNVTPQRGTGAGDSWNAGIILANSLRLGEEEGLFFANAVAGRYVSNPQRVYSTIADLVSFLKNPALRLKRVRS